MAITDLRDPEDHKGSVDPQGNPEGGVGLERMEHEGCLEIPV